MSGKDFYDDDPVESFYAQRAPAPGPVPASKPPAGAAAAPSQEQIFGSHANAFGQSGFYDAPPQAPANAGGPVMSGTIGPPPGHDDSSFDDRDTRGLLHPGLAPGGATPEPIAAAPAPGSAAKQPESYSWYQPENYRYLFNVDDVELFERLRKSIVPWSVFPWPPNFLETVRLNPDLYGPFWITTTVVFLMAAAGNFGAFLSEALWGDTNNYKPDFSYVSFSAFAVYGYNTIVPVILWLTCKFLKINLSLLDCLCIYGYALFVFIPVTVVSVAPFHWLQWLLVGLAGAVSTLFLVGNFLSELRQHVQYGLIIAAIIAVLHVGLTLTFKLYFFRNVYTVSPDPTTGPPLTTFSATTTASPPPPPPSSL